MSEKNETYDYYEERGEKRKKNWFERAWNNVTQFYEDHEGLVNCAALIAATVGGSIAGISRDITKRKAIRSEYELKNLYIYDRKYGHYWKLRKPLSNRQRLDIDTAVNAGQMMGEVWERIRVLAKK